RSTRTCGTSTVWDTRRIAPIPPAPTTGFVSPPNRRASSCRPAKATTAAELSRIPKILVTGAERWYINICRQCRWGSEFGTADRRSGMHVAYKQVPWVRQECCNGCGAFGAIFPHGCLPVVEGLGV